MNTCDCSGPVELLHKALDSLLGKAGTIIVHCKNEVVSTTYQ